MSDKRLPKVLCAPDSFKESLTAVEVAAAMAAGVGKGCDQCPIADGGEGSLDVLADALGGQVYGVNVTGPLGEPVEARFATGPDDRIGIVELAEASGLGLVPPDRRDPARMTSFGTGELIRAAAARGCESIIVCIGGSATVDGGAGIVQALGGVFTDRHGRVIDRPMTGGLLGEVAGFTPPTLPMLPPLRVACDVTSPLRDAASCYGPQKGATPAQVPVLDASLARLAALVGGDPDQAGAGAAGGAGWGLAAMLGARLERGIDLVLDAVDFERRCAAADLVFTGEGRLDMQTRRGKACAGVADAARALGVPVVAIVGSVAPGDYSDLFAEVITLAGGEPVQAIIDAVRERLSRPA